MNFKKGYYVAWMYQNERAIGIIEGDNRCVACVNYLKDPECRDYSNLAIDVEIITDPGTEVRPATKAEENILKAFIHSQELDVVIAILENLADRHEHPEKTVLQDKAIDAIIQFLTVGNEDQVDEDDETPFKP